MLRIKKKQLHQLIKRILLSLCVSVFVGGCTTLYLRTSFKEDVVKYKERARAWIVKTFDNGVSRAGFIVEHIQIRGLKYTARLEVLNKLNIHYGDNIFSIHTQDLLEALKKIDWIAHVTIQKKLPNIVRITLEEHKPYALWQYKNQVVVIAETGVVIPKVNPKDFLDLPLVVGSNANLYCKGLFSILLDYPGLKDMIISAQYVKGRRWRLYFSTNVMVDLPESNMGHAIHQVYEMHHKQKVLDLDVEFIDMRVANKLILKLQTPFKKTKNMTRQGA